jgi:hypothetical protein
MGDVATETEAEVGAIRKGDAQNHVGGALAWCKNPPQDNLAW